MPFICLTVTWIFDEDVLYVYNGRPWCCDVDIGTDTVDCSTVAV